MRRLMLTMSGLILVWSVSMSFFGLAAHNDDGVWAIVGALVLLAFLGLGGLVVAPARAAVPQAERKAALWFMQFFGAFVTTELLVTALIAWVMGNRTLSANNAYEVLGLLIFLALLGVGQGVPVTFVVFVRERSLVFNERRRLSLALAGSRH
jgi:hypothetical protein